MEDRPAADHGRPGGGRAGRHARPAAVHADRRDDARRPADDAAARPLRHPAPARALRRRRPRADRRAARPRILGIELDDGGALRRSRRAAAARRASPTGCSSACATTPRCAATASSTRRRPTRALDAARGRRRSGLDRLDREILSADLREVRRRPGRPLDARGRRRRGARHDRGRLRALPAAVRAARSARRAAASRPRAPTSTSGSRRRARRAALLSRARACDTPPRLRASAGVRAGIRTNRPADPHATRSAYPVLSAWLTSSSARTAGPARRQPTAHAGFRREAPRLSQVRLRRSCSSCSTTTTRRPTPRSSSATSEGRVIALRPRLLRADRPRRRARHRPPGAARCSASSSTTATIPSAPSLEWGVRALGKPVEVNAEGDLPARATADLFPAYDDDGGLLLVLTPGEVAADPLAHDRPPPQPLHPAAGRSGC